MLSWFNQQNKSCAPIVVAARAYMYIRHPAKNALLGTYLDSKPAGKGMVACKIYTIAGNQALLASSPFLVPTIHLILRVACTVGAAPKTTEPSRDNYSTSLLAFKTQP